MKKFTYSVSLAFMVIMAGWLSAEAPANPQPVFVYLFARVTDHVNLDIGEERLRHILPVVERYREAHPEAHVSATVLFSGASSQALADRNAQTHIRDFVSDFIRRGVIEAGYDGTDEPTYKNRPVVDFSGGRNADDRWKARSAVAEKFLAEARDPLTGKPIPGEGGLKKMQEVFGPAASVNGVTLDVKGLLTSGRLVASAPTRADAGPAKAPDYRPVVGVFPEVGGDPETLQILRRYNTTAIMDGIAPTNPNRLAGFRERSKEVGRLLAPAPECAPELFWQDNLLRFSEENATVHTVVASEGPDAFKGVLAKAGRSTIQVVHVELGSLDGYLQPEYIKSADYPPLKYAYAHPEDPKLRPAVLKKAAEVDAAWAREEALLRSLAGEVIPQSPGSRFVSSADLRNMAAPSTGYEVSVENLRSAVADILKTWGNNTFPPPYLRVEGHYLSLADWFQVSTDALAGFQKTGKFPSAVKVIPVYGPVRLVTGHGPNAGEVSVQSIARMSVELASRLHDDSPSEIPHNSIPPLVTVDGIDMNPAQFLRIMAAALANPVPDLKIGVKMTYMLAEPAGIFPSSRSLADYGFTWTLKPAPLRTEEAKATQH